jgi:membrane protease YdiL (CAAX protease family)
MEELFFRGLLYPVLARRYGMGASILLTGAAFGLLHGAQLRFSWAVLIIFLVGIALTAVRAKTKSVAASFLMHVGYNATLSMLFFVATGGFRHLDQLNR